MHRLWKHINWLHFNRLVPAIFQDSQIKGGWVAEYVDDFFWFHIDDGLQ
jgi:hypothetical protein